MNFDDNLIDQIAPDVLRTLDNKRFFHLLDDQMCPEDATVARVLCQGTLATSAATLITCEFDHEAIEDILAVLQARGGFCDCEVLYNIAEESRLKSEYWKAVAAKRRPLHGHAGHHQRSVRIWISIEKDQVGYPESQDWEDLWGQSANEGQFVIDSVPFFAKGIARGDKVVVALSEDGFLAVTAVAERAGHSTFRVLLPDDLASSVVEVVGNLQRIGAIVEVTLERLLAIDAKPEHESTIWNYLREGTQKGLWELQVGYSPD
jgi:hypothetical protein